MAAETEIIHVSRNREEGSQSLFAFRGKFNREVKTYVLVSILLILCYTTQSYAQRNPQFSQFAINNYLINPAITGIEPYGDLRVGYRSQWNGVDGAPRTLFLSFHSPIGTSNPALPYNPVNPSKRKGITSSSRDYRVYSHHGIGGFAYADKIGAFSRTQIQMSYAYHQAITKKSGLSAGMFIGMYQYRVDPDKLHFLDQNDIVLNQDNLTNFSTTLSLGLWYYSHNYYLGASAIDMFKEDFSPNYIPSSDRQNQHFLFSGGYKLRFTKDVSVSGSMLLKWYDDPTPTVDVAVIASFIDRVMAGVSLRNLNEVILITRVVISKQMDFGYSYDFGYNQFNNFSSGTHEVFIGYRLFNKMNLLCPQNFW